MNKTEFIGAKPVNCPKTGKPVLQTKTKRDYGYILYRWLPENSGDQEHLQTLQTFFNEEILPLAAQSGTPFYNFDELNKAADEAAQKLAELPTHPAQTDIDIQITDAATGDLHTLTIGVGKQP